jgi:hypothetical protein
MPKEDTDPIGDPRAWKPVEAGSGWLVLMDAPSFKAPRLIVSEQDEFFVKETARSFYPGDVFKIIEDTVLRKRFLVRLPK